jgi:uncharacterized protein YjbI with pentapeptide repeats
MLTQKTRKSRGTKRDSVNQTTTPEYHQIQAKNWDGNLFLHHYFNGIEFIDCNLSECLFVNCVFEDCAFTDTCLIDSYFINCKLQDTTIPNSIFLHCNNENSTLGLLKATQNVDYGTQENMDESKHSLPKKSCFIKIIT